MMQTASLPNNRTIRNTARPSGLEPSFLPEPQVTPRIHNIDRLLKESRSSEQILSPAAAVEPFIEPPGLFTGVRVALIFNMALGLSGLVLYEVWTSLSR